MSTPATVVDPWLDPFTTLGREGDFYQDLSNIATEQGFGTPDPPSPGAPDDPGAPLPIVVPPVEAPPEPELDGVPKVFQVDGGGTLSMEKGSRGWQATLSTGIEGVREQVFYGKTKDELLLNFGKAQLNATKKIRSQDQKLKLGDPTPPAAPQAPTYAGPVTVRELTADERFEFKTIFDADPIRAMDFYNEKRYGMKPEQFAQRLNETTAARKLTTTGLADSTAYRFVDTNKDYYPDPEGKNYLTMVRYLGRQYLNRAVTKVNASQTVEDLQDQGFWTIETLEAAKDDLNESGLLLTKPAAPTPAPTPVAASPQPAPVPPAPAPVPPRAIPPVERPRAANFGLRVTGNTPATAPETAPSVDDPSNLSDAELEQLMTGLRQSRARGR